MAWHVDRPKWTALTPLVNGGRWPYPARASPHPPYNPFLSDGGSEAFADSSPYTERPITNPLVPSYRGEAAAVASSRYMGLDPTPYTQHPTPYTLRPTPYTLHPTPYRGTSPIRKCNPLGPYRRPVHRVLGGRAFSYGRGTQTLSRQRLLSPRAATWGWTLHPTPYNLQGYLAHKKAHPPRTLP